MKIKGRKYEEPTTALKLVKLGGMLFNNISNPVMLNEFPFQYQLFMLVLED